MFPSEARATGASFCFNFARGIAMLSPYIIGAVAASYGLAVGLGLTALFSLIAVVALLFLPETRKFRT
jgi:hypothetical protein